MGRLTAPLLGVLVLGLASAGNGAATRPALHPCKLGGVAASCGTLIVPENRARPSGRRISLSFAVIKAPHATGKEPLFYFAGGPGGSALGVARFVSQVFGTSGRDLVLLDQRGVGASAPLLCPQPPPGLTVGNLSSYAHDCVAGLRADSRMYGTDAAADDADALRAALGYTRIVVYGGSYGATGGPRLHRSPREPCEGRHRGRSDQSRRALLRAGAPGRATPDRAPDGAL